MRALLVLGYLVVAAIIIYSNPTLFLPGAVLTAPAAFLVGRSRAEWGRFLHELHRIRDQRTGYRE